MDVTASFFPLRCESRLVHTTGCLTRTRTRFMNARHTDTIIVTDSTFPNAPMFASPLFNCPCKTKPALTVANSSSLSRSLPDHPSCSTHREKDITRTGWMRTEQGGHQLELAALGAAAERPGMPRRGRPRLFGFRPKKSRKVD
ncbi:hypothetical protein E2C01_063022 [Portunus trituberculatus]|uniref:Uncharacterized protein n=1 Tax=Portunus trituberculatus TaxID=210409 RepID=A0A5B7HCL8_PORTR|nr:hypothetical protein [Portunus trituberculatus]